MWLKYIFLPLFAGYVLFPIALHLLAFLCSLHSKRENTVSPFLRSGFRPQYQALGICAYIWKLTCISAIMSVTTRQPLFQVSIGLSLLIPVLISLVAKPPYSHPHLLYLSVASKLIVYMELSAAGYYTDVSSKEKSSGYFFGSVFIFFNLTFFLLCLRPIRPIPIEPPPILNTKAPVISSLQRTDYPLFVPSNSFVSGMEISPDSKQGPLVPSSVSQE